jgi:hypothetical protein
LIIPCQFMSHVSSPQFCLVSLFSWVICSNYHLSISSAPFCFSSACFCHTHSRPRKNRLVRERRGSLPIVPFPPFYLSRESTRSVCIPSTSFGHTEQAHGNQIEFPPIRTSSLAFLRRHQHQPLGESKRFRCVDSFFLPSLAPVVLSFQPPFHSFRQYLLILLHPASSPQISDSSNRRHTR